MHTINITEIIHATGGKFFSVDFIKKDGSLRHMTARLGVHKHTNGGGLSFDPQEHNLIVAYDTVAKGYRMINLETLQTFSCGKTQWRKA